MRFVILTSSDETDRSVLADEDAYIRTLQSSHVLLQVFARQDVAGSILLAEVADAAEMDRVLQKLPSVVAGVGTYTTIPIA